MAMPDQSFRLGVIGGAAVLVLAMTYLRFCGTLSLPAKPPPPSGPSGTSTQLLTRGTASPEVYRGFLRQDAATAGVRMPTVEEMSRKLPYRVDEARHVLEPGQPAIEIAGLRLHLERASDEVVLVIQNLIDSNLAYEVTTTTSIGDSACSSARALPYNAMVIAKGATETRTECVWRDGSSIVVTKVETMEISPLSGFYLSQVPPKLIGLDDRVVRGHKAEISEPCSPMLSQVVRTGMDRGDIGWRDLVDFYARHRCQSYQFPASYRAFKSDGERELPAVDPAR